MITDEQKQFLRDLADRRKANGIRLSRFLVTTDAEQAATLADFWEEWDLLLGKDGAVKLLVVMMRKTTEALRELKAKQDAGETLDS